MATNYYHFDSFIERRVLSRSGLWDLVSRLLFNAFRRNSAKALWRIEEGWKKWYQSKCDTLRRKRHFQV